MSSRRKILIGVVGAIIAVVFLGDQLDARNCYSKSLPNGNAPGNGCILCHQNFGGDARNPFGQMVETILERLSEERGISVGCRIDDFWGPELATADPDEDGRMSGEELGDPEGVWVPGEADPAPTFEAITNPGRADEFPEPKRFKRGDSDGDGVLSISDPILNLMFQFVGAVEPFCLDALDFNDSGDIDLSDPIGNLSHQFLGLEPPPPPGTATCGEDPTPDVNETGDLGCDHYDNCES